jgi:protein-tyrosine phosphatase
MSKQLSREIKFEGVRNFRDLGGYRARDGRTIAWRRVFRSAGLARMSPGDKTKLQKMGIKAVIDLRTPTEQEQQQEKALLGETGAEYYNVPFRPDNPNYYLEEELELYKRVTNMGEVYLYRFSRGSLGKRVQECISMIAALENHPLVFHCGAGKDRTGMLAAILLATLGVADEDIINDYVMTEPYMQDIRKNIVNDPATPEVVKELPDFTWEAVPESMSTFLDGLRREYGSINGYLKAQGTSASLIKRLEKALLV